MQPLSNRDSTPFYFDSIDILRGFAALSVVVYHIIEHFDWKSFPTEGPLVWFRAGWIGVDLFFVISGLVIGLSAFSGIDRHGPVGFKRPFMAKRLARIVPLHYLTLLVFIALISPEILFKDLIANLSAHLFFLHNLSPAYHGAINGSNWSLGTEMQFYVLMLFAAPLIKVSRWWLLSIVLLGISWAWRYIVSISVPISTSLGPFPVFVAATQLPGTLDEFAYGLLLAKLVRSEHFHRLYGNFARIALFFLATALTSACMYGFWRYASSYWTSSLMMVIWRSFLGLSLSSILLFALTCRFTGAVRTICSPLYYLGTISYGIYLWHLPVLMSLKRISWLTHMQVLAIALALTCIFASVSWHFFEQPFMKRIK